MSYTEKLSSLTMPRLLEIYISPKHDQTLGSYRILITTKNTEDPKWLFPDNLFEILTWIASGYYDGEYVKKPIGGYESYKYERRYKRYRYDTNVPFTGKPRLFRLTLEHIEKLPRPYHWIAMETRKDEDTGLSWHQSNGDPNEFIAFLASIQEFEHKVTISQDGEICLFERL